MESRQSASKHANDDAQALNTLQQSELLQLLVESVKDYAIIMLDPLGNVISWNPTAQRLKGWRAEEIIGQHFSRFYPAEQVEQGKIEMELRIAAQDGRFED